MKEIGQMALEAYSDYDEIRLFIFSISIDQHQIKIFFEELWG
jgi:hypothetical protein